MFRAQDYFTLYPSPFYDLSFAKVHTEVVEIPEEFRVPATEKNHPANELTPSSVLTVAAEVTEVAEEQENTGALASLHADSFVGQPGGNNRLPLLRELPTFSSTGRKMSLSQSLDEALAFRRQFSITYGGCKLTSLTEGEIIGGINELFCT